MTTTTELPDDGSRLMTLTRMYEESPFPHDSLPLMMAGTSLTLAYRIFSARTDAVLRPLDLTAAACEVLGLLNLTPDGRMSFTDFKKATLLHPATLTYTIDNLEKRKLIKRRRDLPDRRAVVAEITPAGRELIAKAVAELASIGYGLSELTEEDAIAMSTLLSRLDADQS